LCADCQRLYGGVEVDDIADDGEVVGRLPRDIAFDNLDESVSILVGWWNPDLAKLGAKTGRKIPLADVGSGVHAGEEAEIGVSRNGFEISLFGEDEGRVGGLEEGGKRLERFGGGEVDFVEEDPVSVANGFGEGAFDEREDKLALAGLLYMSKVEVADSGAEVPPGDGEILLAFRLDLPPLPWRVGLSGRRWCWRVDGTDPIGSHARSFSPEADESWPPLLVEGLPNVVDELGVAREGEGLTEEVDEAVYEFRGGPCGRRSSVLRRDGNERRLEIYFSLPPPHQ
jgi:hypothetical protein